MRRTATQDALRTTRTDLSSPAAVKLFREQAAVFTTRVTRSKKAARQALIAEGIYTQTGRIAKSYR